MTGMQTRELDQMMAADAGRNRWVLAILCLIFLCGFLGLGAFQLLDQQQRQKQALDYHRSVLSSVSSSLTHELQDILPPPAGEAYSTRTLWRIRELSYRYAVGSSCFLFVVDQAGHYVHHPKREWVLMGQQIQNHENTALAKIGEDMLLSAGKAFYRLPESQGQTWIFSEPIQTTPYLAGLSCHAAEILRTPHRKRNQALLFFLGSIALLLGLLLGMHVERFERSAFKWTSALFSLVLLLNIAFIWYLTLTVPRVSSESSLLQSPTDFYRYRSLIGVNSGEPEEAQNPSEAQPADVLLVPTGIVIRSLVFESADTFRISGYVWQRATREGHEPTWTPIIFPNAVSTQWTNAFSGHLASEKIQGKGFEVRLKQKLEHHEYPLNAETLEIRMVPELAYSQRVAFLPELESYRASTALPGLEPGFFIDGWKVLQTYFSYAFYTPPTHFGSMLTGLSSDQLPELRFNIRLQRQLWGSFLVELMAIITVLTLLFTVFVKTTHDQAHLYKPLEIFGPVIGLYFPLLLAHARVRQSMISIEHLLYVDYLYMIVYLAIITVAMYFVFLSHRAIFWLNFKQSIVPKSLYWPWVLMQIWLVTVWVFL